MRVVENKYNVNPTDLPKSTRVICESCKSKIDIDESDLEVGEYGCKYWTCICGYKNYIDKSITLTEANVQYPQHFAQYTDCCVLSDEETNKYMNKAISGLKKGIDFSYAGTADTLVIAFKSDDEEHEADVIVAKDYYQTFIKIPEERW